MFQHNSIRRGKLTKGNIMAHNQAIRPPSNLLAPAMQQLIRTPQPKMRPSSRRSKHYNSKSRRNSAQQSPSVSSKKDSQISVAIRLRPLNDGEIRNGMKPIWSVKGSNTLKQIRGAIASYQFEYVCPGIRSPLDGSTLNLYNAVSKRIVVSSCKGINGTIFAYGQTSSGKTYTMLGTDKDPGITLLALSDIFHAIRHDASRKYALFISYIEIHNEVINDLLDETRANLRIVDTKDQGPVVKGCTQQAVKTPQDVIQLLLAGEKLRKVSETHSNERSSRSHAIFRIFIQSQARADKHGKILSSVLNLVDLAGSESSTNIDDHNGVQIKEAKHINQSLLCLGRVMLSLSSKKQKRKGAQGYIPYRDSKLTRILQPSLGGNSSCCVICTMSPCTNCMDESLHTLRFAQFTKKVTNHAVVNETVNDKSKLRKYQLLVKALKQQIKAYTSKSDRVHQVFDKMKKLKKTVSSLQGKIQAHRQTNAEMESELSSLRQRVSVSADTPASTRSFSMPSKPATPKQAMAERFKSPRRRRLFVSTHGPGAAKAEEARSEPDISLGGEHGNCGHCKAESLKSFQLASDGDKHSEAEYASGSDFRSVATTPSTIATTEEFQKVIVNLQSKLEEVQGNIETLTNRIATAQFVDINSVSATQGQAPPVLAMLTHPTTQTPTPLKVAVAAPATPVPVIAIDLASESDRIIDDTPELPTEMVRMEMAVPPSPQQLKEIEVFTCLLDEVAPSPRVLKADTSYLNPFRGASPNKPLEPFWSAQLQPEKRHSDEKRVVSFVCDVDARTMNGEEVEEHKDHSLEIQGESETQVQVDRVPALVSPARSYRSTRTMYSSLNTTIVDDVMDDFFDEICADFSSPRVVPAEQSDEQCEQQDSVNPPQLRW